MGNGQAGEFDQHGLSNRSAVLSAVRSGSSKAERRCSAQEDNQAMIENEQLIARLRRSRSPLESFALNDQAADVIVEQGERIKAAMALFSTRRQYSADALAMYNALSSAKENV